MKIIAAALAAIMLVGCDNHAERTANAQAAQAENEVVAAAPAPAAEGNQTEIGSGDLGVGTAAVDAPPPAVAALIRQVETENEGCRGGSGEGTETMRACNRRQVLMKRLQDAGWCWGGADIEADKHFLACKPGDRDYSAGAFDEPYYSEEEIAEAGNQ